MSFLPKLEEDKTKRGRTWINVHWWEHRLCPFAGHRQISVLSTTKYPYRDWPLLWQAANHWKNAEIDVFKKKNWSLDLSLIFVKAKLTIGRIFTGKLCLCSALRIWLGIILLFLSAFFLKSPLNSTHVIFALSSQNIPKYSSFYLSRLSLDKVLIPSCNLFPKICKQRAGTNSVNL